jgi:L-lactate dehydrogenase complex protein LldG
MSDARANILASLRQAPVATADLPALDFAVLTGKHWDPEERLRRLRLNMEAVKTEFLDCRDQPWPRRVAEFLQRENLPSLLYGPATAEGQALAAGWPAAGPRLRPYDQPVETFKAELFHDLAAGFSTTLGGIAETGGLLLTPGPLEPRLLSLVPPVHIALLRVERIFDTLHQAILALGWNRQLPPNALVISGPSKTADIEQTLAYGVHGPRRLLVVLI